MQRPEKVEGVRRIILAADQDMRLIDVKAAAGFVDLLVEKLDAGTIIVNGKGFEELFAEAIAEKGHVLIAGKIQGDDENALGRGLGEKLASFVRLRLVYRLKFHS